MMLQAPLKQVPIFAFSAKRWFCGYMGLYFSVLSSVSHKPFSLMSFVAQRLNELKT